jgi:penicillin amidase
MKGWKKVTIAISVTIVTLFISIAVISYLLLRKSLPDYDAEYFVDGLIEEVKVYRDENAIPMIIANSDLDAVFAMGYIHAQERLFQMDFARRAGEGRLSEIFGSKTVLFDRMFRTIGIYKHVCENYNRLNPLSKRILEAYTKGVNEFIKKSKGNYPIEFDLLGYDPYEWKPEHSLVIGKLMGWELNVSWWSDIAFANLIQKLGVEKTKELLPNYPQNAPTIIPSSYQSLAEISTNFIELDRNFRKFTGFVGTHIGSNNWVVDGSKSISGKPIIANDPHLAFTLPGKWFFVLIRSAKWNVDGFTIPGLPAVVIGKNQNISWVLTNVMADDADFYIEKFDESRNKYFFNNQWKDLSITIDSFAVKDSANCIFEIRKTHRGPVVSEIHPYNLLYPVDGRIKSNISMRWTGLEFSDELFAIQSINRAKNWNEFKNGLKHFTLPGQNFVYADDIGNIGYVCAARLPLRSNASPTLVYDGTTDQYDWKGFVHYEEMPKLFNPPQHFIASANNKTVESFKYHISNVWEPSSRIERINDLLKSKKIHSSSDFKNYQTDFVSPYAKKIIPHIIKAFESTKISDENLKVSLQLLLNWNFELNAKSQVPSIYTHFLFHFLKNTFQDELGKEQLKEYVFLANIPYRKIIEILEGNPKAFFDNVETDQVEDKDDIIRKSLVDAITDLENKRGKNIADWQWGNFHKINFKHVFSDINPLLDKLINVGPFEIGGDGTTLFNTEYTFQELFEETRDKSKPYRSEPYENKLGPSMRYIFDFGAPNYLDFILPNGQSGHFMSEHYSDMTEKWLNGEYIRVPLEKNEFIKYSENLLKLIPN